MSKPSAPQAVGPDRAPVRAWRAWGDRAMPAVRRSRRDKRLAWLFFERIPAPTAQTANAAQDGRPALDDGHVDNADRLLDRLRAVHGEARPDLFAG